MRHRATLNYLTAASVVLLIMTLISFAALVHSLSTRSWGHEEIAIPFAILGVSWAMVHYGAAANYAGRNYPAAMTWSLITAVLFGVVGLYGFFYSGPGALIYIGLSALLFVSWSSINRMIGEREDLAGEWAYEDTQHTEDDGVEEATGVGDYLSEASADSANTALTSQLIRELERLAKLRQSGDLTEEEYMLLKERLLAQK